MPRRFIDRQDDLQIPLERRHDRAAYITQAVRRHHLPARLSQLDAKGTYVPAPPPQSQQAVVKIWPASAHTTRAHLRYLEKGKGLDGIDATLFTGANRSWNRAAFITQAAQDSCQHRLIISLATDATVDLQRFTQTVIRQMEFDLKTPLIWVGAVHHDTAHPHVHVVIRGRDAHGKALYLQRHYWAHGLRHRVRALATRWLGPVTKALEIERLEATMTEHMWQSRKPAETKTLEVALSSQTIPPRPRLLTPHEREKRLADAEARADAVRKRLAPRLHRPARAKPHGLTPHQQHQRVAMAEAQVAHLRSVRSKRGHGHHREAPHATTGPRRLTPAAQRQQVEKADARVERLRQTLAQRGLKKQQAQEHEA